MASSTYQIRLVSFAGAKITTANGTYETHLAGPRWCTCEGFRYRFDCRHVSELARYMEATVDAGAAGNGQRGIALVRG